MLADVVPQMQALLEEVAPGRFPPLAARCPLHGDSPVKFLVLEDLAPQGFVLGDRQRGLGLRHSLLALRSLARFHAASCALLRRHPQLAQSLGNNWRSQDEGMRFFVEGGLQGVADACRGWPGFEEHARRLDAFKEHAMETFIELNDPKPGAFNVITHGDFWVNNMMFSYEDGLPSGYRMVDLQLSHVASPAIDLVYFLSGSVSENVHTHHQGLLFREYHHELRETMALLGMQAPSLEELMSAVDAHGPFSLLMGMCGVPVLKSHRLTDVDALLSGDDSGLNAQIEVPAVKRWLQRVIPDYVRKGWL